MYNFILLCNKWLWFHTYSFTANIETNYRENKELKTKCPIKLFPWYCLYFILDLNHNLCFVERIRYISWLLRCIYVCTLKLVNHEQPDIPVSYSYILTVVPLIICVSFACLLWDYLHANGLLSCAICWGIPQFRDYGTQLF